MQIDSQNLNLNSILTERIFKDVNISKISENE
jgi:hypothetical protein